MAVESILDRLDREHGNARQYVASLIVVGGATREQVAEAMARKYSIPAPTLRSVTNWQNGDEKLVTMIRELESIQRELSPDDDLAAVLAKMPEPVNAAQAASDLFSLAIRCRPFAELLKRDAERHSDDVGLAFDPEYVAASFGDDPAGDDVREVLTAGHETAAEFEADCERRLAADPLPPGAAT